MTLPTMQPVVLPRLFVIGDSISMHYGPLLERFLAGSFAYDRKQDAAGAGADPGNLDIPTGPNGGDSAMVLAYLRLRRKGGGIPADVLLLNCGLHDLKVDLVTGQRQVPLSQYCENLSAILSEAREMGLACVWVRTTPVIDERHNLPGKTFHRFAADVSVYNRAADLIMAQEHVPAIDLHGFSKKLLPDHLADHVHYDEAGRALQAAFIAGALLSLQQGQQRGGVARSETSRSTLS